MDLGSVIGVIAGFFFVIISILIGTSFDPSGLMAFVDYPSILIVFGGVIASIIISYPIASVVGAMKATKLVFMPPKVDHASAIENIIKLANLARKEGILALEETAKTMDDEFLEKGVMLIVDGTDPELTRSILETELAYIDNRHSQVRGVWDAIASLGPSWGMIGTLIGLILMLQALSDPTTIGPKMAVALITTFYGSMIANFLAGPFAGKLKYYADEESLMKEVLIEGMLSILAGENPRIIEEKLKSFLSPAKRTSVNSDGGGAGEK